MCRESWGAQRVLRLACVCAGTAGRGGAHCQAAAELLDGGSGVLHVHAAVRHGGEDAVDVAGVREACSANEDHSAQPWVVVGVPTTSERPCRRAAGSVSATHARRAAAAAIARRECRSRSHGTRCCSQLNRQRLRQPDSAAADNDVGVAPSHMGPSHPCCAVQRAFGCGSEARRTSRKESPSGGLAINTVVQRKAHDKAAARRSDTPIPLRASVLRCCTRRGAVNGRASRGPIKQREAHSEVRQMWHALHTLATRLQSPRPTRPGRLNALQACCSARFAIVRAAKAAPAPVAAQQSGGPPHEPATAHRLDVPQLEGVQPAGATRGPRSDGGMSADGPLARLVGRLVSKSARAWQPVTRVRS